VEDANTEVAANPRPKSQLAQYLRSITASNLATDDDKLEGPSEVAWLEPDSPYHSDRSYASTPKKNESWSSNSSTWNLSLVQNPLFFFHFPFFHGVATKISPWRILH